MTYTALILTAFGMAGILLHNLVKLNDINRANDGFVNLWKYWKLERFTIMISIIVVGCAVFARNEIPQLANVGSFLGIGFVAIGYMAQSIIVKYMGKTQKYIDNETKND